MDEAWDPVEIELEADVRVEVEVEVEWASAYSDGWEIAPT